jgi:hypothetical protein
MRGGALIIAGTVVAVALAGCKPSWFESREPWRAEAEAQCLKSGAVKEGAGVALLRPISGPGVCGADFPLKVAALGEGAALGYTDEVVRPPGSVPVAQPAYPQTPRSYPQPYPSSAPVTLAPSPARASDTYSRGYESRPVVDPMSDSGGAYTPQRAHPRAQPVPDPQEEWSPEPDDVVRERAPYPGPRRGPIETRREAPRTVAPAPAPQASPVPLGRNRLPVNATAAIQPAATLACPIVAALDRWVVDSVQPSAMRWFNQPVVEIRQISAYSCRGMNGQIGARISEHAFGNALDIASFTLADGRRVTVKDGWRGLPEEQGFLRDIQSAACDQFTTVLAPGSNRFHYDHIHVDLMRRSSGTRICNPEAMSGAEVAARAARSGRGLAQREMRYENPDDDPFAYRGGSAGPTGSISRKGQKKPRTLRDIIDDEEALVD